MKEIRPCSDIDAMIPVPGSKSITHRAFVIAALALGQSKIKNALLCEDTIYTLNGLKALGVDIEEKEDAVIISGVNGRPVPKEPKVKMFLGNSGTSLRLLTSVASLAKKEVLLTGDIRLQQRPMEDLLQVLKESGVKLKFEGEQWHAPLMIQGPLRGGRILIPGDRSSQFISSLLLVSPCIPYGMEIVVQNVPVSVPYIRLTLDVMRAFGMNYRALENYRFFRISPQPYRGCTYTVEGDVSSAAYFWAAAAVTGGTVKTTNINPDSNQGDMAFLNLLEKMGCYINREHGMVTVKGAPLSSIEIDMMDMPDQVPTLAVVAMFAKGKTVIANVPHLRDKESDRLSATREEIEKIGGKITEQEDGLIIEGIEGGGHNMHGAEIDPHNDHRIAMSMAVAGLKIPGIKIKNEGCVAKSLPDFWRLWESLYND